MADLLSQSREASARIRVENIIHADITVELMEILELYAELLLARAGLLDVRDKNIKEGLIAKGKDGEVEEGTGLEEAAASIIYSAPRLPRDVKELGIVRGMLIERFGKDFAMKAQENEGGIVPMRVTEKLKVDPPSGKLVQAYLEEIARTYGVDWPLHREEVGELEQEVQDEGEESDGVGGGMKEQPILADGPQGKEVATPKKPGKVDISGLSNATPPTHLQTGAKSPVSVAPPGARTDNLSPKVKLPGGGEVGKGKISSTGQKGQKKDVVGGAVPTVDDLAARFKMLKR